MDCGLLLWYWCVTELCNADFKDSVLTFCWYEVGDLNIENIFGVHIDIYRYDHQYSSIMY